MKHGRPEDLIPRSKPDACATLALTLLQKGPVTVARLVDELPAKIGATSRTEKARARLRRAKAGRAFDALMQQGKAKRVERGTYALANGEGK